MTDGCENIDCAVRKGHLNCIKRFHQQSLNVVNWQYDDTLLCARAARNGHLSCLKYLHENGYKWDWCVCAWSAENGHLNCLKYAHENGCELFTPERNKWVLKPCEGAARNGHLDCLKYAYENGCPWDRPFYWPSFYGHLDCLKYARSIGKQWEKDTFTNAARSLSCLKYLYKNGCPMNERALSSAARLGKLKCLKYLMKIGCPWNKKVCNKAVSVIPSVKDNKALMCLRYLHSQGGIISERTFNKAAKYGRIMCLSYLHENKCPWKRQAYFNAVEDDHLDCIEFMHMNDYPLPKNKGLCGIAAYYGHLDCLKYFYDNGCTIENNDIYNACIHCYYDCVNYMMEKTGLTESDFLEKGEHEE
jgi:ankyrin repeat protein